MLKLWRRNRNRPGATPKAPGAGYIARRRLGLEAMEGRLMLSGDAPGFVSWDAYSPEFRIALVSLAAMPPQAAPAEYVDGGFILPGDVLVESSALGTSHSVINRAHVWTLGGFAPTTTFFNNSGSGNVSVNFSGVILDTPNIPVIVFPGTDSDLGTTFVDQPADAGPQPAEVTADEGGAIPINSILAFVGHTDSWKRGERVAATPSIQTGGLNSGLLSIAQPTQREIAGEWARPPMLEMAGGEPGVMRPEMSQQERTPVFEGEANLRFHRPFSSGTKVEASATDTRPARDIESARRNEESNSPGEMPAISRARLTRQAQVLLVSHSAQHQSPRPSVAFESTDSAILESGAAEPNVLRESLYAEVYDELGTSDAISAQAIFNRAEWHDSWKATPLLMILALERIAASNSRRAKKESSESAGRRPQLPASTDPPDRA